MATLQQVKYTSILPDGKVSQYKENEKVQFTLPTRYAYIDGKQSYFLIETDNTSTQTGADPAYIFPVVYQSHIGASALIERIQIQELPSSKVLEEIDNYNSYVGLLKSYGHDSDDYNAMSAVERVTGHSPAPANRLANNPVTKQFYQGGVINGTDLVAGVDVQCQSIVPIHMGLFSGLGKDKHMAFPNSLIGGSQINLDLEQANIALSTLAHNFVTEDANGTPIRNSKNISQEIACVAAAGGSQTTLVVLAEEMNFDTSYFGNKDISVCGFQPGMVLHCFSSAAPSTSKDAKLVKVEKDGNQLKLDFGMVVITDTIDRVKVDMSSVNLSYNIAKIELRILETAPSDPSVMIQELGQGINFQTTHLTKISIPANMKSVILDIPSVNTRAISLLVCPSDMNHLEANDDSNSKLYPQISGNNNYIWQVRNSLIPNRPISISNDVNNACDNALYYKQLDVVFRDLLDNGLECFTDSNIYNECTLGAMGSSNAYNERELANPMAYPLQLAPQGRSFNLVSTDPQLRINFDSAPTNPVLYHVYVNHVRTLVSNAEGNQILF